MVTDKSEPERKAVIGSDDNFWLYSSNSGFDLTHPATPSGPEVHPQLRLGTTTETITIDPSKTALMIIDMQNFFLSPAFGRQAGGAGHLACDKLRQTEIPAARKAGVQVIWLNWGLTDQDIREMPPSVKKTFGFEAYAQAGGKGELVTGGKNASIYKGIGNDCGIVKDPITGDQISAGRLLMRDQWNTALYEPLAKLWQEGRVLADKPDAWIHKDRMSGLWGSSTLASVFFEKEDIRTLLFAGVNTDQCVNSTLTDAFSKGYDCVMLSDGCGTTSPDHAKQCVEYNTAKSWGFVTTCEEFARGVHDMR
ncbi:isochorismatase family protein [Polychaeton citri CBS 116435]|uniref:Isochorismatase family protein n=1 Tax=Polychaeton citri CBS 116435 TaxID=1314669 RepID=A0A9P4PZN6_9PEZI|nr:isochorismatase family protein [Polychaeton citri CBS 116435]